ncbi:MAG: hypothetical protein CME31_17905 [Gimesia sp.]|jgi:Flp pilus assembly secretin CpaC|uniref:Type II/III secretion system secretin-like domain-containing protein n=1 Tax=Gimesia maris TaxID=122 RepID=A0A3D3RF55_9PLAN|nr:hypothetical protein [Gimesia sp.]HCO27461.1 hypothetical protein [Gimesia maris]|tara:strand:- start:32347 stop:33273 length:927 start_codon:yes stop_codon:yes gene_type:complete
MFVRYTMIFALSLTTISFGAEPEECPEPQRLSPAVTGKSHSLSALDHLSRAKEQLKAAGLSEEAEQLRELTDQLNQRINRERAELAKQITALQKQSEQLRQLTGRPDKILCRCRFLELSSKAAAEFAAAAEPVKSTNGQRSHPDPTVSIFKNAEEAIEQLKKAGRVTVVHGSPEIVTVSGQSATSMSGGKYPVLIPAGDNQTSVEWKRFGVFCKVEPRLLDNGRIQLEFSPEISQRDYANAVKVNGLTIPGLTVRRIYTQAEMNLGETLVVRTVSPAGVQSQVVNAKSDTASSEDTVTLFMVTPVAID